MRTVLKAKSRYSNDDVAKVWEDIASYVSADEAEQAVTEAVAEVRRLVHDPADFVYGWSGGKDSIALQVVMERAGVHRAVLGSIPHLEWHSYLDWVDEHAPERVFHIRNTDLTPDWLARPENHRYLFPRTAKLGYFWTNSGTRYAQKVYQAEHNPAFQIYGRRWADGNQIGPDGFSYNRASGIRSYSPLRAWPHEMVLAVIHYNKRSLPPLYSQPHGWTAGTGTWCGRRVGTIEESWRSTWEIEQYRVEEAAAAGVPGAREWMEANGHGR